VNIVTRKLTFGFLYDFRNPPEWRRPWADLYAETLEFIAWSESAGFDGAWVPEHHVAEDGYMPAPLVALSAIAARTSTIKIGPAVALAPLYHPVRFAEECAVLDILSNGRLEIALAIGYRKRETDAYGVDFTHRGSRFDEFLQIVSKLWAGETVSFEGQYYTVKNAALMPPPTRGHIPLYIGGFADKALERVAKYGDGYFGDEKLSDRYKAKLRALGKDPEMARIRIPGLFLAVAHDPQQAMEELAPYYHYVNNAYGAWANEDRGFGSESALEPMTMEQFKASGIVQILTPGEAIDRFRAMQARMAVEHVMMAMPAGFAPAKFVKYAEVFAREVIPAFR
jgi:alkanesulfonate monooxygenase SsuD/methylene tetrahydromethanopterin reductase-like flavin-dependent oxidoreductase (luciferase family)